MPQGTLCLPFVCLFDWKGGLEGIWEGMDWVDCLTGERWRGLRELDGPQSRKDARGRKHNESAPGGGSAALEHTP